MKIDNIINPLADYHRVPNATQLYYIYTSSLDLVLKYLEIPTVALIMYRFKHRKVIFGEKK